MTFNCTRKNNFWWNEIEDFFLGGKSVSCLCPFSLWWEYASLPLMAEVTKSQHVFVISQKLRFPCSRSLSQIWVRSVICHPITWEIIKFECWFIAQTKQMDRELNCCRLFARLRQYSYKDMLRLAVWLPPLTVTDAYSHCKENGHLNMRESFHKKKNVFDFFSSEIYCVCAIECHSFIKVIKQW